jgi:NAD(P)-dependent dehydrogenase (short-subunit alcohol dehydrogenase family)
MKRSAQMNLAGKACLITGGTSGIGAATAIAFAKKGASVMLASRSGLLPDRLAARLIETGAKFEGVQVDVADPRACERCVDETVERLGRLDVLVNSGGGPVSGSLEQVTEQAWMAAFAVHVHSVFFLARAAAPHMARAGGGSIILLGSTAGLRGCLGALAYGVAKGALPQFARALARELADRNIRVNCVAPGVIRTPFQDFLTPEQAANNIQNRIPLHREGKPEDVAEAIGLLVQNEFITGESLVIDGGMTMRMV